VFVEQELVATLAVVVAVAVKIVEAEETDEALLVAGTDLQTRVEPGQWRLEVSWAAPV